FGPMLVGFWLIAMPFISKRGERSPRRRPWAWAAVLLVVMMIVTLWVAGAKSNWSPNFAVQPLPEKVVGVSSGPISAGARFFHEKGCLNCHLIQNYGGRRGPDLTSIGAQRTREQLILTILGGRGNMPAYANNLTPEEMNDLLAFLESRKSR
ncbi:MAG: Cytochrome b/b6 domain, partial [Pedosphaera sp.]|nr:Cytochrome b/b6 domain [Pedosphaera sp.]